MTANVPIEFEKEIERLGNTSTHKSLTRNVVAWGKSISERVEAQTIERCSDFLGETNVLKEDLPRLYGPKSDKEEGK